MKLGLTLVEMLAAIAISGILFGLAIPRLGGRFDSIAVRGAASDVAGAFAIARHAAVARGAYVSVRIDSARRSVVVASGNDTLLRREIGVVHGAAIHSNRDSMAYDPVGLGYGAANQSIVVRRGSASDTVIISRLGRVRYRN